MTTTPELESFHPASFRMHGFESGGGIKPSLAAIFDLQGFTDFCSQSDPHLSVPPFVDDFIKWLFDEVRDLSIERGNDEKVYLYNPMPFFAKFLGDGVLFLWEVDYQGVSDFCSKEGYDPRQEIQGDIGNIVSVLFDVCNNYEIKLKPKLSHSYSRIPQRLRCGVAQGLVCTLGQGADYVGPCINMAARLQKLGGLGMCVLKRGIDLSLSPSERLGKLLIPKKANIRGVGEELVYVVKTQYEALSETDKQNFSDP
ncbi:MAG TPA: hypothetical protein VEX60_14350 [Pyrinomonadaceae bacterium]|nr:hypothetical protein [Pyrinomonadaceae bacterium]